MKEGLMNQEAMILEDEGFEYQLVRHPGSNRIRVWVKAPWEKVWSIGHSKEIPAGKDFAWSANVIRRFLLGSINHDRYNSLLPH